MSDQRTAKETAELLIRRLWNASEAEWVDNLTLALVAEREAAAQVAERQFPRGGAHTYASENAEVYRAQEDAAERIAAAIRSRTDQ